MAFGPVIARSRLAKNKIIWTEGCAIGTGSDGVHGSGLQIQQYSSRYIFTTYEKINND